MRDKKCLVPCDGLYADIEDDSLRQNVMAGTLETIVFEGSFIAFLQVFMQQHKNSVEWQKKWSNSTRNYEMLMIYS